MRHCSPNAFELEPSVINLAACFFWYLLKVALADTGNKADDAKTEPFLSFFFLFFFTFLVDKEKTIIIMIHFYFEIFAQIC